MTLKRGLAFKLAALILSTTVAIFVFVFEYNYQVSRKLLLKNVESSAANLVAATVFRIETVLASSKKISENIAFSLDDANLGKEEFKELCRRVLTKNPEVFGSAIALEPFALDSYTLFFAPYYYRNEKGEIVYTCLGNESYRYFYQDWYQMPKELGHSVWTEPYFDEGGGHALMTTYSVPFYRDIEGKKVFFGVVTVDLSLDWLEEIISSVKFYQTGYAFLISRHGTFVTHPDKSLIMNETIFTLAEAGGRQELRRIGKDMINGGSGFEMIKHFTTGQDCFLSYAPIPSSGWSLGVIIPKDELMADISSLGRDSILIASGGFVLLFAVIALISRSITKPLRRLTRTAKEIATGNLDALLPTVKTRDEVADLTASFKHMKLSLKDYIQTLTKTTAEKQRIESELKIARDIQMGILPRLFPAFPERSEFDIYAMIEPAREVGGDLYDFFFIDDNRFCFLIGDVSDKGVPAAFFMAVTKTLLKATAEKGLSTGQILSKVNNDLAAENESCMFVTLFCAIIDLGSGRIEYASAGHNPPVLLRREAEPEYLEPLREPVAGAMEGFDYSTRILDLAPGDTIYLYTDGVTEAMDNEKNIYSEDRLLQVLHGVGQDPEDIVTTVMDSIREFAAGAVQSDDITMLGLRFWGIKTKE